MSSLEKKRPIGISVIPIGLIYACHDMDGSCLPAYFTACYLDWKRATLDFGVWISSLFFVHRFTTVSYIPIPATFSFLPFFLSTPDETCNAMDVQEKETTHIYLLLIA